MVKIRTLPWENYGIIGTSINGGKLKYIEVLSSLRIQNDRLFSFTVKDDNMELMFLPNNDIAIVANSLSGGWIIVDLDFNGIVKWVIQESDHTFAGATVTDIGNIAVVGNLYRKRWTPWIE